MGLELVQERLKELLDRVGGRHRSVPDLTEVMPRRVQYLGELVEPLIAYSAHELGAPRQLPLVAPMEGRR
jgi:hypothetical protein